MCHACIGRRSDLRTVSDLLDAFCLDHVVGESPWRFKAFLAAEYPWVCRSQQRIFDSFRCSVMPCVYSHNLLLIGYAMHHAGTLYVSRLPETPVNADAVAVGIQYLAVGMQKERFHPCNQSPTKPTKCNQDTLNDQRQDSKPTTSQARLVPSYPHLTGAVSQYLKNMVSAAVHSLSNAAANLSTSSPTGIRPPHISGCAACARA